MIEIRIRNRIDEVMGSCHQRRILATPNKAMIGYRFLLRFLYLDRYATPNPEKETTIARSERNLQSVGARRATLSMKLRRRFVLIRKTTKCLSCFVLERTTVPTMNKKIRINRKSILLFLSLNYYEIS
ncbi:MAG: hypothetical protein KAU03_03005 [Candidatus Altiarchaeales archaeon]|nr:hypothetical protein [Candidatus Altiarchaeales archaeon]